MKVWLFLSFILILLVSACSASGISPQTAGPNVTVYKLPT